MAFNVKAWCNGCAREVSVPLTDCTLVIPEPDLAPRCRFSCPKCGSERIIPTSDEIADVLISRGVSAERVDIAIPSQHIGGEPLNLDDLIDLHEDLLAL